MPSKPRRRDLFAVGVTGASGSLGRLVLPRLLESSRVSRALALDLAPPAVPERKHRKLSFGAIDLTRPGCADELAHHLSEAGVKVVIHLAFFSSPIRDSGYAHEVEAVGTAQVLAACARAKVRRFVMVSTTLLYGASPKNPGFLTEDRPLAFAPPTRYLSDKAEAERQVERFRRDCPSVSSAVLRLAPVVGPRSDNPIVRYLGRKVAPTVLGFDPLVQCLHEDDAAEALLLAASSEAEGDFNVVGRGALPLSAAVRAAGALPLPLPIPMASAALRSLNALGVLAVPPALLDYLHYSWVADGGRAERELGFKPRFSSREALLSLAQARRSGAAA